MEHRICDLHLIAYLIYKGKRHTSIEKEASGGKSKVFFIFNDVKDLIDEYFLNETVEINIQDYISAIYKAKLLINSEK